MSEQNTARYLKYAIGEIILVVIGILIALQINTWNEARKDKKRAFEYHQRLFQDLERIDKRSNFIAERAETTMAAIVESVALLEKNKPLSQKEIETLNFALLWYARFNYQMPDLSTLEEMKSNGDLGLIYNINLRKDIVDFNEFLINTESIFNTLGSTIQNNAFIDNLVRIKVDTVSLDVKHAYNINELRESPHFINSFSRMANHWRGSTYFMNLTLRRCERLKERVENEIETLQ